jgi:tetratricopeptide (TPR) repeat protein
VKRFAIAIAALGIAVLWSAAAEARNPHCAGGIQYLTQWQADKIKGNTEDYRRELTKSIQQLEMCAAEDPNDFEALGYLGWSYAEADSMAAAGNAFSKAIAGLTAKNDKKGADRVMTNRDSYWATMFNAGIASIKTAQELYPDFCKAPSDEEKPQKEQAAKRYEEALASLDKASLLKPGEARTIRNIATVHALRCEYSLAAARFSEALKITPNDSDLVQSLRAVRTNLATELIDAKKYDEAIAYYKDLLKDDANDDNSWGGLGDAHFDRATRGEGDQRKQDFKAAGDAYAKAAELRGGDPDLWYNAGTAFQNAGEWAAAESAWRKRLEARKDDTAAMSELGSVLAEQKKFEEAIKTLHQAVVLNPQEKALHRRLGAVYTKAGNNQKGTEELMVYLALQSGKAAADPATEAKKSSAASQAGKTLASVGVPEAVYPWTAEGEQWESWFYWNKRAAYHFKGGMLAQKSDWTAPDLKTAAGSK